MKRQRDLRSLYDHSYTEKFEKNNHPTRLERLLQHLVLDPDYRVVDFGCGSGILMPYVAPRVYSYVGVDFSQSFIDIANEHRSRLCTPNATFVCSAIGDFCGDYRDYFNVGLAMDLSEHVYDEEWLEILTSIRLSLKTGGSLYLHTPNGEFFLEIWKSRNFIVKQFPEHVAVRNPEQNVSLLEHAGFQIRRTLYLPHYNILRHLDYFSALPLVGKYLKARLFIEAVR